MNKCSLKVREKVGILIEGFKSQVFDIFFSFSIGLSISVLYLGGLSKFNPINTDWISGDNVTSYLAQLFYLSDDWRFPLLANPNYGGILSENLTYTGPSPILSIFQKIFFLKPSWQFFGLWILLNLVLQIFLGIKILKLFTFEKKYNLYLSSLFFVTPFLLFRIESHYWLISHYLLLWSFYLVIAWNKTKYFSIKSISLLVLISYLTNAYLLGMVLIILAYYALQLIFVYKENSKFRKLILTVFITSIGSLLIFDGIRLKSNAQESLKSFLSSTYGAHPYNLISVINPQTGVSHTSGILSPSSPTTEIFSTTGIRLGITSGAFEGFAYLGLGVLILIVIALANLKKVDIYVDKKNKMLISFFIIAIISFATTYRIGIGNYEKTLYFPELAKWGLSFFRSSGRFIWIICYAILIFTLISVNDISRKVKKFRALVVIALLIQILDLFTPVTKRYEFMKSGLSINRTYEKINTEMPDNLRQITENHTNFRIWPLDELEYTNYVQINYWAWKLGMKTDVIYAARTGNVGKTLREMETFNQLCGNNLNLESIYVVHIRYVSKFDQCAAINAKVVQIGNQVYIFRQRN